MMAYRCGGFWRRAMAIAIDTCIIYALLSILILLEVAVLPAHPYSFRPDGPGGLGEYLTGSFTTGHLLIFLAMNAAYFTYFHGTLGQTPGKILFNLKVIRTSGRNLTYGRAFLRWVCYGISSMFFYLGFLWAAFDGKKQAWHDKLAGTLVVLKPNGGGRRGLEQLTFDI